MSAETDKKLEHESCVALWRREMLLAEKMYLKAHLLLPLSKSGRADILRALDNIGAQLAKPLFGAEEDRGEGP